MVRVTKARDYRWYIGKYPARVPSGRGRRGLRRPATEGRTTFLGAAWATCEVPSRSNGLPCQRIGRGDLAPEIMSKLLLGHCGVVQRSKRYDDTRRRHG